MRNTTRASNRPGRTVVASALATALGLSLLGMAPASFAQPAATHQFAVASQPLGEALNRLAETAGVQIMVPPDLVRGHTAPALAGQYTVQQALDRLLSDPHGQLTPLRGSKLWQLAAVNLWLSEQGL